MLWYNKVVNIEATHGHGMSVRWRIQYLFDFLSSGDLKQFKYVIV